MHKNGEDETMGDADDCANDVPGANDSDVLLVVPLVRARRHDRRR